MEIIASFGAFAMIMLAMAVGVIVSGKTLKGSCGGSGSSCACADQGTANACQTEDHNPSQSNLSQSNLSQSNLSQSNLSQLNRNLDEDEEEED
jgi:hypothetical protein